MIRRIAAFCFALILAFSVLQSASAVQWEYPLSPLTVVDWAGYLVLANKDELLSKDFEPQDLTDLTVRSTVRDAQLRKAAALALREMFEAAEKDGYTLYVKSAYRSYGTQKTMYSNRLEKMGRDDGLVQAPGASDHQTGLGVDVLNYAWTKKDGMNEKFASEPEAIWMAEHCWEYGFIIRYQRDKEDVTGIKYEPWHLRYVGSEAAAYIHEKNYALEEFCAEYRGAITDYEAAGGVFQELVSLLNRPKEKRVIEILPDGEEEYAAFYE